MSKLKRNSRNKANFIEQISFAISEEAARVIKKPRKGEVSDQKVPVGSSNFEKRLRKSPVTRSKFLERLKTISVLFGKILKKFFERFKITSAN